MTPNNRKPTVSKAERMGLWTPVKSDKAICVITAVILVLLVVSGCSISSEDSVESACPPARNDSEQLREYISGNIRYSDTSDDGIPARLFLWPPSVGHTLQDSTKPEGAESEDELILELRDSAGHSLKSINFYVQPGVFHVDPTPEALEENPDMIMFYKADYFEIFVANPPHYASMAVLYEGNELEIEEHSANTPCLSVSWPTEGQPFDEGDHILISFKAIDTDEDELSYDIHYSADGGNWYGWKKTGVMKNSLLSATISVASLKSSDQARLAVTITDGERSMVWESPIFALPDYEQASKDVVVDSDIFTGRVSFSSDGSYRQVSVDPVHSMPRPPVYLSAGEYILELLDADGTVLRSVPFSISEESVDIHPAESGEISSVSSQASFDVIVSNPPDYAKFRISHSGKEISVFDRSQNAPSLSMNGPSERQRFANDDTIALSWTGNDLDGDELDYIVYYSTDGGTSYNVISPAGNSTSVNFDDLDGSEQTRFAVSVSDGTRSTFVETPVFAVDNHPPVVYIISPLSSSVLADEQGVLLKGRADDKEDGSINSNFSWSSNIDGHLGSGDNITSLSATDFTEGNHIITLTVTDSNGATAAATTDITIKHRQNQPPTANDDIIRVAPDDRVLIDVLANDIDVEGDFKHETLAIVDRPVLGTTEIAKNEQRKSVIAYTAGSPGTDYFTYLICDEIDCDVAQVAVTIATDGCTIWGTERDDTLRGTPGNDVICGLGGNDTIYGNGGDDIIRTGGGNDTIYGEAGNDLIYSVAGDDTIYAGEGDDTIKAGLGDDVVFAGAGDDTIYGEAGDDTTDSGTGDDIVRGSDGNDRITGGDGADELYGGPGDDILDGGAGNDTIHGSKGDDTIYGGPGDDIIRGNLGADTIYPGEGNDTLEGSTQQDTIIQ